MRSAGKSAPLPRHPRDVLTFAIWTVPGGYSVGASPAGATTVVATVEELQEFMLREFSAWCLDKG